tara:strand:- start:131 stop:829 length:699 start_codon:yes stop_codon:yes gene_type:complete
MSKADVIILSCMKYNNGDNSYRHSSSSWEKIKSNFKSNLLFIFYGNLEQKELFKYDKFNKELSIRTSDQYDNIPTKTWLAYFYWFYHINDKKSHLITFGDDCKLTNEQLFISTNFNNIDYGGVKIHGPAYNDVWHQNKVQHTSPQYNKRSPRNKPYKQWVHEGTGVIFSKYAIQSLLQKHNWNENISEAEIKSFTKYVFQTCWYNDVLLSYEFDKLNIEIKLVNFFGIKGDR